MAALYQLTGAVKRRAVSNPNHVRSLPLVVVLLFVKRNTLHQGPYQFGMHLIPFLALAYGHRNLHGLPMVVLVH